MHTVGQLRPIHPFPARMAPSIAWRQIPAASERPLIILDPMAGSGTTLAIARARGHAAIGFDTDPLAVLIARAWCTDVSTAAVTSAVARVLSAARRRCRKLKDSEAYPTGANEETKRFVRYWYDLENRRQLAALVAEIAGVQNATTRLLLWCAVSRLIITKQSGVSLAMDVPHSRPHRVYSKAPLRVFDGLTRSVQRICSIAPFKDGEHALPKARVRHGDARRIALPARSVDLVITSPPYLNAIDYLRGHRLSLVWMNHALSELRETRANNIGAEISLHDADERTMKVVRRMAELGSLPPRFVGMLARYVCDMDKVMGEISRVLKSDGRAVVVVGDSTVRGTFVRNSYAIRALGNLHGLGVCCRNVRAIPDANRYLPPPANAASGPTLQNRMRSEVILTFCSK
jgi:adenine-specific DNA methylase